VLHYWDYYAIIFNGIVVAGFFMSAGRAAVFGLSVFLIENLRKETQVAGKPVIFC